MSENHDVYVVIQEDLTNEEALAGKAARMIWYSVDHFDSLEDAEEMVKDMEDLVHAAHGFHFSRLDG
jgi:hypothetical protein